MWDIIIAVIVIIYILASIIVYFLANSNIIPSRRNKEYEIDFGAELRYLNSKIDPEKKIAYWVANNENNADDSKTVILLHGFTRTSDKLQSRAQIYWEMGYSLYFVDNLGHGYSSDQLYPSGYRYSREVKHLIEVEKIDNPIIHGLSMGAIAGNVIAQVEPHIPKAIVCEALPFHFNDLYRGLLKYLNIPYLLFPWLEWVSRRLNWKQFDKLDLDASDYHPYNIECPMLLIHSKSDMLFTPQNHFWPLVERLKGREDFRYWLVDDARHTDMDKDQKYPDKLHNFVSEVVY